MGSSVHTITIDADDPRKLAGFWEQVLDYERTYESSEGDDEVEIVISPKDGKGDDILFGEVHDEKKVKNRIHLDLKPTDQDAEVERVLALGATRDRHQAWLGAPTGGIGGTKVPKPLSPRNRSRVEQWDRGAGADVRQTYRTLTFE